MKKRSENEMNDNSTRVHSASILRDKKGPLRLHAPKKEPLPSPLPPPPPLTWWIINERRTSFEAAVPMCTSKQKMRCKQHFLQTEILPAYRDAKLVGGSADNSDSGAAVRNTSHGGRDLDCPNPASSVWFHLVLECVVNFEQLWRHLKRI